MHILAVLGDAELSSRLTGRFRDLPHSLRVVESPRAAEEVLGEQTAATVLLIDLEVVPAESRMLSRSLGEEGEGPPTWTLGLARSRDSSRLAAYLEAGLDDVLPVPFEDELLDLRLAVAERTLAVRCQALETRIRRQREKDQILTSLPVGYVELDSSGKIERVNARFSELTGLHTSELVGRTPRETFLPESALPDVDLRALAPGRPFRWETTLPTDVGKKLTVELIAQRESDDDGRPRGAFLLFSDLSVQVSTEEALRHREEYFRVLWESTSDLITILDIEGRILYQSDSSHRLLGWSSEDLVGTVFLDYLHEADREHFTATFDSALEGAGATPEIQFRFPHHYGEWRTLEAVCKNLFDNPVVGGIVVTSRDITDRIRIENALKREQARFQQLFRGSPTGIVVLDDESRVVEANRAFLDLFQFEIDEVRDRQLDELVVPPDLRQEAEQIATGVRTGQAVEIETRRTRKDGTAVDVSVLGYPLEIHGERVGSFETFSDITERKNAERRLFHDATHDRLTGLPNRSLLTERLERCLRRCQRRADYRFAIVFIDLDGFKQVNDSLGHAVGDDFLVDVARRLGDCVRPGDTVSRLGGDEFLVILDDIANLTDVTTVADRILDALTESFDAGGSVIATSGSLGIAFGSAQYEAPDDLVRDADIAMYRAKARGKGCWEIFDDALHRTAVQRLYFENDLRRAIERDQLRLDFQPILDLDHRGVVAVEALLRWHHPERGILPPDEMLPVCEETGLIVPIGRWVLREAARRMRQWRDRSILPTAMRMSVNLSRVEIVHAKFVETLDEILEEERLQGADFAVDIAEHVIAGPRREEVTGVLWQLRDRGVRIAVDDFGSGLTSIGALRSLPIDQLKIDRTFVHQLSENEEGLEIARAISALAASLELPVVAEGIETPMELAHVRALGFEYGQGLLFHAPLGPDRLARLLATAASGR